MLAMARIRAEWLAFCACLAFAAGFAFAQPAGTAWVHDPATPGDWFDPANWSNGVPTNSYPQLGGMIASGTAQISSGSASSANLYLGWTGSGNIVQSGPSSAYMGNWVEIDWGSYTLNDNAYFSCSNLELGYMGLGPAEFVQNGGMAEVFKLQMGWDATYRLAGGTLNASAGEEIGESSEFIQSGGVHTTGSHFSLSGTYRLTDGVFSPLYGIGLVGTGQFIQSGGATSIYEVLAWSFAGKTPTLSLSGGTFHAEEFNADDPFYSNLALNLQITSPAANVSAGTLRLLAGTNLSAVAGSHLKVAGQLVNKSTNSAALAGLSNLNLIVQGGSGWFVPVEAAGKDLGAVAAGWTDNFALAALTLGDTAPGKVRLVNDFDNQPAWAGVEALYVDSLVLNPGAAVDLGGLNLYYRNGGAPKRLFVGDAFLDGDVDFADYQALEMHFGTTTGAFWADGDFDGDRDVDFADYQRLEVNFGHQTPEPGALALVVLGLAALLNRRRR